MIRVTIWNEFIHERTKPEVQAIYPRGIHVAIAEGIWPLLNGGARIRTATLDEPQHGLTDDVLHDTDVLTWWGHGAHDRVTDEVVERVHRRVLDGMGLIVLHSGHLSKIFVKLMGTTCMLRWRDVGELERLWIVNPSHPIVDGISGEYFEIPRAEMYGEHFDIPPPDELITISWFEGGEVFRSGCTFQRGKGKIFYFRPGHETFPIYYHPNVLRILANGVRWAAPSGGTYIGQGREIRDPVSPILRSQC
jgi:trehalose utilization protein